MEALGALPTMAHDLLFHMYRHWGYADCATNQGDHLAAAAAEREAEKFRFRLRRILSADRYRLVIQEAGLERVRLRTEKVAEERTIIDARTDISRGSR